jgi:hypothetical protein
MAHSDQPATTTPPVFDPYAHPHPAQQPAAYQFPAPVAPPSAPEPTQADAYAPTAWGASTEEFTAPSGQRCLLRKPDIAKLFAAGLLDQVNSLVGITDTNVWAAKGLPPIDMKKLIQEPDTIVKLTELLDKVLPMLVAAPTLLSAQDAEGKPIPAEERVAGAAYIDYVDFVDKVAIFSKAMSGLKVAEPFRPGSAELSERVANVAGAQVPTEPAL